MVRAEIVAIGSELVLGGVADTNSLYLAEELLKLGIEVRYKTVVGDDSKDMEAALQHALGRADVVITTGGLGQTEDDLTRKVVARVTGRRRAGRSSAAGCGRSGSWSRRWMRA